MDFFDLFKLSTRMFAVRTSRTALTILGMGVGIGVILFLFSFGYGLQSTLLKKITTSDSILTLDVVEKKDEGIALDQTLLKTIKAIPGVQETSSVASFRASGKVGDVIAEISASAVEENYFRLSGLKLKGGDYFPDSSAAEAVISASLAGIFGKQNGNLVGKNISVSFFAPENMGTAKKNAKSSGKEESILEKSYKIVGIAEGKKNIVFVPSESASQIQGGNFSQLKVRSRSSQDMEIIREKLTAMGLSVSSLSDIVAQANKVFGFFQAALLFFGVVALVVSAIGMFNTMTVALLERTEEIGIMKSVGASSREISLIFMAEALIMGLLGGVVGIILGIAGGELLNVLINILAAYFGGGSEDLFSYPTWFVASIFIFSGLVGLITGFFPARRAGKINPLDALRYK